MLRKVIKMIHKIIKFENFDKLNQIIFQEKISSYKEILIQIFTGASEDFVLTLTNFLKNSLPYSKIIGLSAYNGIINEKISLGETILSFSCFEKTKIEKLLIEAEDLDMYPIGVNIAKKLIKDDTKLLLIFSHGDLYHKNFNTQALLEGINSINKKIIVAGGSASSSLNPYTTINLEGINCNTFVFDEANFSKYGIVAVSLSGKELKVSNGFNLGWKTLGKEMIVTKAEKVSNFTRIYTIDNIPVLDLYEKYFGKELAKEFSTSVLALPFVIKENGIEKDATPWKICDDNSVIYSADIKEGDSIWFGYGDKGVILDEALDKARNFAKRELEAIFAYSCITRPAILEDLTKYELQPFSKIAPLCGFFTNGEFYTSQSKYMVLGKTLSLVGLTEKNKESQCIIIKDELETSIQMKTSRGAYNMIKAMNEELEEDNKILQSLIEINGKILEHDDIESFLEYILNKAFEIIKSAKHIGFLFLNSSNQFEISSLIGFKKDLKEKLQGLKFFLKNDINLRENKEIKEIIDFERSPLPKELKDLEKSFNKMIGIPVIIDNKIYGLISFNSHINKVFTNKDIELMTYFAEGIGIVINNKLLLDKTMYLSKYDALTAVPNRGYFEIKLEEYMKNIDKKKAKFSIGIIDLNYLKRTNDVYGHNVGDSLLKDFAKIINSNIKKPDIFARFGGDEFALAFFNLNEEEVNKKLQFLREKVEEFNKNLVDKPYIISYSIGFANYPIDGKSYDALVKIADERMYEEKKTFRNKNS